MRIRFENEFAKQLYLEVSGIQDMRSIDKSYISLSYIWAVWQKVYKANFGCTRYPVYDLWDDRGNGKEHGTGQDDN